MSRDMTIGRWVRDRARTTPHRAAIVFGAEETTYGELDERSERLAAGLVARGLRTGDRVASLTPNRPEHVELFFACAKAGLILVPLNVRLTAPELAYQLRDAEPALLFAAPGLLPSGLVDAGIVAPEPPAPGAAVAPAHPAAAQAGRHPTSGPREPAGDASHGIGDAAPGATVARPHGGPGPRTPPPPADASDHAAPAAGRPGRAVGEAPAAVSVPRPRPPEADAAGAPARTGPVPVEPLTRAGLDALHGVGEVPEPPDDAGLLLVYTSGTTGRPKGAVLTHANCFWTNLSLDRGCELRADDVVLQVLPQFHVGGWNVQPLLAWWKGATVVLEPDFDPGRALRLIAGHHVTTMMGVPATYLFMARHPDFAAADLSSLRCAVVGGAPMPEPLLHTWLANGVRVIQGYGLTEAAPNVLCLPADEVADRIGWAGRPYPHVEVALLGPDGERFAGPGRGELVVRGPNVFAGYWRNPAATEAAVPDGWLRTGDVAERDAAGCYRIRDRVKDMYVSGGENVYPAEVESVLAAVPGVAEVAVVGVPDDRWGEVGCAFVVGDVPAETLLAHCREHLAGFKVPRHVRHVPELPRSAVGKTLKTALRAGFTA